MPDAPRSIFDDSQAPQPYPAAATQSAQLVNEMHAIKGLIARLSRQQAEGAKPPPDAPGKLFDQYLALIEQEVAEELADEILDAARERVKDGDFDSEAACRDAMRAVLSERLPVVESVKDFGPTKDGRPRIISLVGPTGVGKTTTIAKLAATFKLKHQKKVALITLDTYRIAAVDQLRTYAGIINVPLQVVNSPAELKAAVDAAGDVDVVLIDTAGRSQRDDKKLSELARFMEAARPHETHLVLASNVSQRVLMENDRAVQRGAHAKRDLHQARRGGELRHAAERREQSR